MITILESSFTDHIHAESGRLFTFHSGMLPISYLNALPISLQPEGLNISFHEHKYLEQENGIWIIGYIKLESKGPSMFRYPIYSV